MNKNIAIGIIATAISAPVFWSGLSLIDEKLEPRKKVVSAKLVSREFRGAYVAEDGTKHLDRYYAFFEYRGSYYRFQCDKNYDNLTAESVGKEWLVYIIETPLLGKGIKMENF